MDQGDQRDQTGPEKTLKLFEVHPHNIQAWLKMPCRQETIKMVGAHFFFWPGRGSGTLMKPKNHYMGVVGLLVRELEPEKDLKAEKG